MNWELFFKFGIGAVGLATSIIILIREGRKRDDKIIKKLEENDEKQLKKINEVLQKYEALIAAFTDLQSKYNDLSQKVMMLLDLHKNPNVSERLAVKLRHTIDFLASDTHKEIRRTLVNALEEVTPILNSIISTDFANIDRDILYEDIKRKAVSLQPRINFYQLKLKSDPKLFIEETADAIKSYIKLFCSNVSEIAKEKTNGERIKCFFDESKDLVTDITKKTIEIYEKHKA